MREAIRLKPGLPKTDALLAMSLSELGQHEEALPAMTKAFSQSSDPVLQRMAGLHLQRIYMGLGRDADAVEVALRLSRLHPDDPEVLYHSGRLFANFAYVQTIRLATVAPDSVWLHLAAGEANQSQGLYDAAIREYRHVIAAAPRRPGIRLRLGRALLERSNKEARARMRSRPGERLKKSWLWIPQTRMRRTSSRKCVEKPGSSNLHVCCSSRPSTAYPGFDDARVGLARTLIALGRPTEALDHLRAAIKQQLRQTTLPTISWPRRIRRWETPPSRRRRSPSSTACAPSNRDARASSPSCRGTRLRSSSIPRPPE